MADDGGTEKNPWAFGHTAMMPDGTFYTSRGMTLRDWFAGRAMQGLIGELSAALADPKNSGTLEACTKNTARLSYAIADAMLRERNRDWK